MTDVLRINTAKFFGNIFFLIFTIKFFETFTMFGHGDALSYHLVTAKIILNSSLSEAVKEFPSLFQGGYFELIYFIPYMIFGTSPYTQIMGQAMHFLLGQGLASILVYKFIKDNRVAALCAISILTIGTTSDFFILAKNGGALSVLILISAMIIYDPDFFKFKSDNHKAITLGVVFGLAVGVKFSAFFAVIPMSLYYAWSERGNFKNILLCAFSSISLILPVILFKGYYLEGAFFYPSLLKLFPGNLPNHVVESLSAFFKTDLSVENVWKNIKSFYTYKVILVLVPGFYIWNIIKKDRVLILGAFALSSLIVYIIITGGVHVPRFLMFTAFLNLLYLFYNLQKVKIHYSLLILLSIGVLADSKIDKSLRRITKTVRFSAEERKKLDIPLAQIWNVVNEIPGKEKTYIFSDLFPQLFYADPKLRLDHFPTTSMTTFFYNCKPQDLDKYDYFILTFGYKMACYDEIKKISKLAGIFHGYQVFKRK